MFNLTLNKVKGNLQRIRHVLTTSALYTLTTIFSSVIGLVLLPIYLKVFSLKSFGLFDLYLTIANLVFLVFEGQIASAYERFYYEAKAESRLPNLASGVMLIYSILFFVFICICLCFFYLISKFDFHEFFSFSLLLPVLASVFPKQIYFLLLANFRLEGLRFYFVLYSVIQAAITFFASLLFLLVFKWGVVGALWGALSGYILLLPFALLHFYGLSRFKIFQRAYTVPLIKYGFPALPAVLSNALMSSSGRFVVIGSLSLSALGLYSAINRISTIFSLLIRSLNLVWSPAIIKQFSRPKMEVIAFLCRAIHYYTAGGAIFVFVLLMLAPLVFKLFFVKLAAYYYYLAFPLIAVYWQGWAILWTACIDWTKKTHIVSFSVVCGAVLTIILQVVFVHRYDLFAAFFASIVGNILTVYLLKRFALTYVGTLTSFKFWWSNALLSLLAPLLFYMAGLESIKLYFLTVLLVSFALLSTNVMKVLSIAKFV